MGWGLGYRIYGVGRSDLHCRIVTKEVIIMTLKNLMAAAQAIATAELLGAQHSVTIRTLALHDFITRLF